MKKLFLTLVLLAPSLLFAQSPFDGTWMVKLDSAQFPTKPDKFTLNKGMYDCLTCVPAVSIKADGTDQKVMGHPDYDTLAARVVNANEVEIISKKAGKTVGTGMQTVSADGNTLTAKFTNTSEDKPVTGEMKYKRVEPGPAGSHAVSGAWRIEKVSNVSSNGLMSTYKVTADGMKWSDNNGESYEGKFDGKDYPVQGDLAHTMVSLKRISDDTIEETDKQNGKIIAVSRMTVSKDGKTIHVEYNDKLHGTVTTFIMEKQS